MKIKQFISGRWPGLKALALCAMAATAFVACKDDETDVVRDPISRCRKTLSCNAAGETHKPPCIPISTEGRNGGHPRRVNIWPKEGSDDGVSP